MKCTHCGSENVKVGKCRLKYISRQRYRYKNRKRFFIERNEFEGRIYLKWIMDDFSRGAPIRM